MNTDSVMMDRELGFRYFSKGDGKVYETVPTGVLDKDGTPSCQITCSIGSP